MLRRNGCSWSIVEGCSPPRVTVLGGDVGVRRISAPDRESAATRSAAHHYWWDDEVSFDLERAYAETHTDLRAGVFRGWRKRDPRGPTARSGQLPRRPSSEGSPTVHRHGR